MALRNSKIASDLLLTNYRFLSSKSDVAVPIPSIKVSDIANAESKDYRYVVSNAKRPVLPKIDFPKEPEELIPPEMRHLQPAMLPKFIELRQQEKQIHWESVEPDNNLECPFPEPIKELRTKTLVLSDQKKAELKSPVINANSKIANFNIVNRNYSTSPFFIVSRSFAKKPKSKGAVEEKCEEKPKKCKKESDCPSFISRDCPPGKPKSDCYHAYLDPKCTKKMAPYPSYSESCAERLEEDPSECMQCPWQKCGGVEAIKPPKRGFHTSTHLNTNLTPIQSDVPKQAQYMPPYKECDAKKEPCKRPPGKCEKSKEESDQRKKCPEQPKKKKCDSASAAFGLWDAKENLLISKESWQTIEGDNILALENDHKLPFDKYHTNEISDEKYAMSQKCHRKERKALLKGCSESGCRKNCACVQKENTILKLESNCPKNKGGMGKGPHKRDCPAIDKRIDDKYKPKDPCCESAKKGRKERRQKPKVYVPDQPDY